MAAVSHECSNPNRRRRNSQYRDDARSHRRRTAEIDERVAVAHAAFEVAIGRRDHVLAVAHNQGVGPVVAAAAAGDGLTRALILVHVLEVPIDVADLVLILAAETHNDIAVGTVIRTTTIIVEADIPSAVVVAAAACNMPKAL